MCLWYIISQFAIIALRNLAYMIRVVTFLLEYPSILPSNFLFICIKLHKLIIAFRMSLCGCVVSTTIILVFLLCIPKCIS